MSQAKFDINSVPLFYNAAAHFAAAEKYPNGLLEELKKPNADSYEAVIWGFAEMAKQAELYRRFMGETPRRILSADEWRNMLTMQQLRQATKRVIETMVESANDDGAETEAIDVVLQQIEKKTGRTG